VTIAFLLLLTYFAVWANVRWPFLQFKSALANSIFFIAAQLLPFLILGLVSHSLRAWPRVIGTAVAVLLIVVALPVGCTQTLCAAQIAADGGKDRDFEKIQEISTGRGPVAVYLTNCGATCDFGILIRQECEVLPGLLVVRPLFSVYRANEAEVEVLGPASVRLRAPPYPQRAQAVEEEVELKNIGCSQSAG
jgi:hypothetical protein